MHSRHASRIVRVENGERPGPLRFKQPAFGRRVVREGVMPVQMILRDVERHRDIGMKFGNGFKLKTG